MNNVGVKIEFSEEALKVITAGACFLGVCYLFYKLVENIPDDQMSLPEDAKDFSFLPDLSPHSFDDLGFNDRIKEVTRKSFDAEAYSDAVRASAIELYEIVREKSGVKNDATTLIQKAFRGQNPPLRFVGIAPEHVENVQSGLIDMMEGFSKSIRKTNVHAKTNPTREEALQEINIACYLADQVERYAVKTIECDVA